MSSDNVQSAVTYTSISSDSDGPSWVIPLMNAGEFPEMDPYEEGIPPMNVSELPEMDPYEEVAQQGKVYPLSPAYIPDPIELDEHAPVYVPEPQHPEYHAPSDDDIQVEDDDDDPGEDPTNPMELDKHVPINVLEPEHPEYHAPSDDDIQVEDDDDDPEEDPSEEHEPEDDDEDFEEDSNEEHEPKDEDAKEPSEDSEETEPFEEDETTALIDAFAAGSSLFPLPPTSPAYDQAPLGHRAAMNRMRDDIFEEDMPHQRRFVLTAPPPGCDVAESPATARAPKGQYDFVDTVETGQGLICSPGHDAQIIARAADRVEDVGYVRALQASERKMMTSIEEVNLRAYLSFEARNRALLARLETLETHVSRMEWQRQSAEDLAVTQMMRIHALEARARTDTVEDTNSSY
nr:hypothetical protein [Tanacetum cinerariifolium]